MSQTAVKNYECPKLSTVRKKRKKKEARMEFFKLFGVNTLTLPEHAINVTYQPLETVYKYELNSTKATSGLLISGTHHTE